MTRIYVYFEDRETNRIYAEVTQEQRVALERCERIQALAACRDICLACLYRDHGLTPEWVLANVGKVGTMEFT